FRRLLKLPALTRSPRTRSICSNGMEGVPASSWALGLRVSLNLLGELRMTRETAEFAYALHAGLSAHQVPEFDDLHTIGMAATLAIHIKGLGEIEYEVLRKVSDYYMSIP